MGRELRAGESSQRPLPGPGLPECAPGPQPCSQLCCFGGQARAGSKPVAEPGSLAEGPCPPDSGWGHLFLAEGASFKLLS